MLNGQKVFPMENHIFDETDRRTIESFYWSFAMGQETGTRPEQQDSVGVSSGTFQGRPAMLAVLADGMGGMSNGAEFSRIAVETHLREFREKLETHDSLTDILLALAFDANRETFRIQNPDSPGGTTLVSAILHEDSFSFLSVGDSRIYLLRGGRLLQLNREHTLGPRLDERAFLGRIPMEEAKNHQSRAALISSIGDESPYRVDFSECPVHMFAGDKLVLVSDGVYNSVSDRDLEEMLTEDPEPAKNKVLEEIKKLGLAYQDNNSILIVEKIT